MKKMITLATMLVVSGIAFADDSTSLSNSNVNTSVTHQAQAQAQSQAMINSGNSTVSNSGNSTASGGYATGGSVSNSGNSTASAVTGASTSNSSAVGGDSSASASNNGNGSNNTSINQNYESHRAPVQTAYAASLTSGLDTCLGSVSGGVQTQILGLSGGGTHVDKNCVLIKQVHLLQEMGLKSAACYRSRMGDEGKAMDEALTAAGVNCKDLDKPVQIPMTVVHVFQNSDQFATKEELDKKLAEHENRIVKSVLSK